MNQSPPSTETTGHEILPINEIWDSLPIILPYLVSIPHTHFNIIIERDGVEITFWVYTRQEPSSSSCRIISNPDCFFVHLLSTSRVMQE